MNDKSREEWVMNSEGLYRSHRASKVPMRRWIRENRALIDWFIAEVTSGKRRTWCPVEEERQ